MGPHLCGNLAVLQLMQLARGEATGKHLIHAGVSGFRAHQMDVCCIYVMRRAGMGIHSRIYKHQYGDRKVWR